MMVPRVRLSLPLAAGLLAIAASAQANKKVEVSGRWSGTLTSVNAIGLPSEKPVPSRLQVRRTFDLKQVGNVLHLSTTFHAGPSRVPAEITSQARGTIESSRSTRGGRVLKVTFEGPEFSAEAQRILNVGGRAGGISYGPVTAKETYVFTIRRDGRLGVRSTGEGRASTINLPSTLEGVQSLPIKDVGLTLRLRGVLDPVGD